MNTSRIVSTALLSFICLHPAAAQVMPDAGQTLLEQSQQFYEPKESSPLSVDEQKQATDVPGGASISIQSITFRGNTLFDEATLKATIGDAGNQPLDMQALRAKAKTVSDYYHDHGYPFARAYLPPQEIKDGNLIIEIVEGRYGRVEAEGADAATAQEYLSSLKPGDVIESHELERATLILSDQPGIQAAPIIRPGQELGTGDLRVPVSRKSIITTEVGGDNFGNRYSGEYRGKVNMTYDSPFLFGDQIQFRSLGSDEAMWLGSLSYSLPLGTSGLRGQASYYQTNYSLGKQFSRLEAEGFAKVSSVALTYPLIRSQRANLTTSLTYQHKDLEDRQDASNTKSTKYSDSIPLSFQYDIRDSFAGGGVTYGTLTIARGNLNLDADLHATDATTAHTDGEFDKLNFDIARIQRIAQNLLFYARYSAQWTDENLDSSEGFGLGGSNGVRAYPSGEAYGDEGWLAQAEMRYTIKNVTPFVFYDTGRITINHDTWSTGKNNTSASGVGFGVRYLQGGWSMDASLAWRTQGGEPQSDTMDKRPRALFSVNYKF